ncbi:MAG: hypothetical protein LCH67_06220 [Bacteroidetes bacterium]|nr:hypothetical protein [Bacteroidota bacterium]
MNSRTKSALEILQELYHASKQAKYPTVPYLSVTKFSDKKANDLTRAIITFLQLKSQQAERVSSEGRVIDNRQTVTDSIGRIMTIGTMKRVYSSTTKGTADISATINGRSVKIEVKIQKDVLSEAQKAYQKAIESAGGIYLIAKDFQSFYDWFMEFEKSWEEVEL